MQEILRENRKLVVVEVADVFLAQNKFEAVPDETLSPEDYQQWINVEDKATRRVFKRVIAKAKKQGFQKFKIIDHETADKIVKRPLSLGLNGMYLFVFQKEA